MVVKAKKNSRSSSENCKSRPGKALFSSVGLNHCHWRRGAMPADLKRLLSNLYYSLHPKKDVSTLSRQAYI
jgi:hypothetical protein